MKKGILNASACAHTILSTNTIALNEADRPILIGQVETLNQIVFITNQGRYGHQLIHDLEEFRWRDIGNHLNKYVKLNPDEKIINGFIVDDFDTNMFIVSVTKNGIVKKSTIKDLEVVRNNRLYEMINLEEDDVLIGSHLAFDTDHLLLGSKSGQFMRLEISDINAQGLRAKGVIGMRLREDDEVTASNVLSDETDIYILSDRFHFKRIKQTDILVNNRNTMGTLIARKVKSNPHHIKYIGVGNINDAITLYKDDLSVIDVKDIPIMDTSASYSQVIKDKDFYVLNKLKYSEKVPFEKEVEPIKLDI